MIRSRIIVSDNYDLLLLAQDTNDGDQQFWRFVTNKNRILLEATSREGLKEQVEGLLHDLETVQSLIDSVDFP
jgi:hypothetical protein